MIYIEHCTDFEFYSGNSKGAIQGYGYVFASGKSIILVTPQIQPKLGLIYFRTGANVYMI
jgi:hypothetical protein